MHVVAGILAMIGFAQLRSEGVAGKIVGLAFIAGALGIVAYRMSHPVIIQIPQFVSPGY